MLRLGCVSLAIGGSVWEFAATHHLPHRPWWYVIASIAAPSAMFAVRRMKGTTYETMTSADIVREFRARRR